MNGNIAGGQDLFKEEVFREEMQGWSELYDYLTERVEGFRDVWDGLVSNCSKEKLESVAMLLAFLSTVSFEKGLNESFLDDDVVPDKPSLEIFLPIIQNAIMPSPRLVEAPASWAGRIGCIWPQVGCAYVNVASITPDNCPIPMYVSEEYTVFNGHPLSYYNTVYGEVEKITRNDPDLGLQFKLKPSFAGAYPWDYGSGVFWTNVAVVCADTLSEDSYVVSGGRGEGEGEETVISLCLEGRGYWCSFLAIMTFNPQSAPTPVATRTPYPTFTPTATSTNTQVSRPTGTPTPTPTARG